MNLSLRYFKVLYVTFEMKEFIGVRGTSKCLFEGGVRETLYAKQVAHQTGVYPKFCSMKRLGIFLLSPGWGASPSQGYTKHLVCRTHLNTWAERGTTRA